MPEDPKPESQWPLPSDRDELLRRVVAEGQRKLLINRLLMAAATVAVVTGLATGLAMVREDPGSGRNDAVPEADAGATTVSSDTSSTSSPERTGLTTDTTVSGPTTPPPSSDRSPTPSSTSPQSGSSPPGPDASDPAPGQPPVPTTPPGPGPTRPDPPPTTTTRPPSSTTTTTQIPLVTVGPITRSPETIVERPPGGSATCPGATTSEVSAPLDHATSATLTWEVGTTSGSTPMQIEDGTASVTLGPFGQDTVTQAPGPVTVTITVTVTVTGAGGQAHRQGTVTLIDCPIR